MTDAPKPASRSGRVHELKCWPEFYECILRGTKPFEVRKDDRGFQPGDVLWLREFVPSIHNNGGSAYYTGRECQRTVTYLFDLGCPMVGAKGFVVMGLAAVSERGERALLKRIANANVIFPSMCANNMEAMSINDALAEYRTKPDER